MKTGSYFVLQVRTGFEIEAKEMLKVVLKKSGDTTVKAIYAMEKHSQLIEDNDVIDVAELKNEQITEYLKIRRIQSGLNNLRRSCQELKQTRDVETLSLLDSYRQNIRELTQELKDLRKSSKKVESVMNGYILVELNQSIPYFPANLWHLMKTVPKVIGMPSKNNIPEEEIEHFFQMIDMSPEIELELDEYLKPEEYDEIKNELLYKANQVIGTEEEKQILERIEELPIDFEEEVQDVLKMAATNDHAAVSPKGLTKMLGTIKLYVAQKKLRIKMSHSLFELLYIENATKILTGISRRKEFIERLRCTIDTLKRRELLTE